MSKGLNKLKEELIKGLNEDLAFELGTAIRYLYQASQAVGPVGEEVRRLFQQEVTGEMQHAVWLADQIVALGGEPTTTPAKFEKPKGLRAMIQLDLEMERRAIENYRQRAAQAEAAGEVGLKLKLETLLVDESDHLQLMQRLLRGL